MDADRDCVLSIEELLEVMNAGELGTGALGDLLQSALPALEAAEGALVGEDELARVLGVVGAASAEDCAAIVECLDGDGDGAITIEEFRLLADLLKIEPRLPHLRLERCLVCSVPTVFIYVLSSTIIKCVFSFSKMNFSAIIKCVFIYDPPWTEQRARERACLRPPCEDCRLQPWKSTGHTSNGGGKLEPKGMARWRRRGTAAMELTAAAGSRWRCSWT